MGIKIEDFIKPVSTPSAGRIAGYRKLEKTTGKPEYDSLYDQAGKDHDVDPNLLWAQGKQETIDFNEDVMRGRRDSPAGARGPGQFMKDTALEFGLRVDDQVDERSDPVKAIPAQAKMMRKLLDRTNDIELSLAGYNSGHNHSPERLRRNLTNIAETKTYRDRIMANYKQPGTGALPLEIPEFADFSRSLLGETKPAKGKKASAKMSAEPSAFLPPPQDIADLSKSLLGDPDAPAVPPPTAMPEQNAAPAAGAPPIAPVPAAADFTRADGDFPTTRPRRVNAPQQGAAQVAPTTYEKREVKPGESYFSFEKDGATKDGDKYLGKVDGKYRFVDPQGDEFEIADPTKDPPKYLGARKKIRDAQEQDYLRSDRKDSSGANIYTRDNADYIVEGSNIKQISPKRSFEDDKGGKYDYTGRKNEAGQPIYSRDGEDYLTTDNKILPATKFRNKIELADKSVVTLAKNQKGAPENTRRYTTDKGKNYFWDGGETFIPEGSKAPKWLIGTTPAKTEIPTAFKDDFQNELKFSKGRDSEEFRKEYLKRHADIKAERRPAFYSDNELAQLGYGDNLPTVSAQGEARAVLKSQPQTQEAPNAPGFATTSVRIDPESIPAGQNKYEGVFRQAAKQAGNTIYGRPLDSLEVQALVELQKAKYPNAPGENKFVFSRETGEQSEPFSGDYTFRGEDLGEIKTFLDKVKPELDDTRATLLMKKIATTFGPMSLTPEERKQFNEMGFTDEQIEAAYYNSADPRFQVARIQREVNEAKYRDLVAEYSQDPNVSGRLAQAKALAELGAIDQTVADKIAQEDAEFKQGQRQSVIDDLTKDNRYQLDRDLEKYGTAGPGSKMNRGENAFDPVPTEEEVQKELKRRTAVQLSPEEIESAQRVGKDLEKMGIWGQLSAGFFGTGGGQTLHAVAGILRPFSSLPLVDKLYEGASKAGTYDQVIGETSKGDTWTGKFANLAGSAAPTIARLALLSKLPGGAVVGLTADSALMSAGSGASMQEVAKEGAKGAVLGVLFASASKLAGLVDDALLTQITPKADLKAFAKTGNITPAMKNSYYLSKVAGEGVRIGTLTGGTYELERLTGADPDKASDAAIMMAVFDIFMHHGTKVTNALDRMAGKVFRVWTGGKPTDVSVDPNGAVKIYGLLPERIVDAEVIAKDQAGKVKPFEMTKTEFEQSDVAYREKNPGVVEVPDLHKMYVEQALIDGETVPEKVLKDYPDLAQKYAPDEGIQLAPDAPRAEKPEVATEAIKPPAEEIPADLMTSEELTARESGQVPETLEKGVEVRNSKTNETGNVLRSTAGQVFVDTGDGLVTMWSPADVAPPVAVKDELPSEGIESAAQEAATSPANELPEPTPAQIEAGNYKKGHVNINGLDISVEFPVGSTRKGTDRTGKDWSREMEQHYGYIKRTVGADTENIDVFIKNGTPADYSGPVFVVDQNSPDGKFDEHKALLGYDSESAARDAYMSNYAKDWKGLGAITEMPFDDFKSWAKDGKQEQPVAGGISAPAQKNIDTPEFQKFFEKSKAVDESGKPLMVKHGSPQGEVEFTDRERGIYFTSSDALADRYADSTFFRGGRGGSVHPAYLAMQNPLELDALGKRNDNIPVPWQEWKPKVFGNLPKGAVNIEKAYQYAIENGHDGLIVKNVVDTADPTDKTKGDVYVVKSVNQIWPALQGKPLGGEQDTTPEAKKEAAAEIQNAAFKSDPDVSDALQRIMMGDEAGEIALRALAESHGLPKEQTERLIENAKQTASTKPKTKPAEKAGLELPESRQPSGRVLQGGETEILVPGTDRSYKAQFVVREIKDVYPSHNSFSFQPNPDYYFLNDRRYDQEAQYQTQVINRSKPSGPEAFNANYLLNDSPTSEGPPVIEPNGNVLGGNSRTMILNRVYKVDPKDGLGYVQMLRSKAAQFGIEPSQLEKFEQPILVREMPPESLDEMQRAITDLNEVATTPLTAQEKAVSEAAKLSESAVDYISGKIEDVGDGSLSDALNVHGVDIVNKLIDDGVFAAGDRNVLFDDGKITDDGKKRIERLLLGRIFTDLDQMQYTPPALLKNLERLIAPLAKAEGSEWDLLPHVRAAIDLIQEAQGQDLSLVARQKSLVRNYLYTPAAVAVANTLKSGPVKAAMPFKQYVGELSNAKSGGGLFGAMSRDEAFKEFFGEEWDEPTTESLEEYNAQVQPPLGKDDLAKLDYGTAASPNTTNLAKAFYAYFNLGKGFPSIIGARKFANNLIKGEIETGSPASKQVEEAIETGIVLQARNIVNTPKKSVGWKMGALADLYENQQPNLAGRTSTSIAQQAFSTPAPLAYAASRLAGVTKKTKTYDPTAGNGMLLIEADNGSKTIANELNEGRFDNLESVFPNAKVENKDATAYTPEAQSVDVVIANPPFGVVKEENKSKVFKIDERYSTTEIDHAIAFKALDSMKDEGRATLIVGGVQGRSVEGRAQGYDSLAKRKFYSTLYNTYNVVDHFTVAGDLYKKQGAAYPVDVIVIDGRGKSERTLPAAEVPRVISSWVDLAKVVENAESKSKKSPVKRTDDSVESAASEKPSERGQNAGGAGRSDLRETGAESGQGLDARSAVGQGALPDRTGTGSERGAGELELANAERGSDLAKPDDGERGRSLFEQSESGEPAVGDKGLRESAGSAEPTERKGDELTPATDAGKLDKRPAAPVRRTVVETVKDDDLTGLSQVPYEPESRAPKMDTLVPTNLATATYTSLNELRKEVGSPDEYVTEKLGFSPEQMKELGAEQVDGLALAIYNIEKNAGFIIGDQTGIGKGRVVGGVLEYARKNGYVPIFVTERPDLYKDMVGEMESLGLKDIRPLMTNADAKVPLDDNNLNILSTPSASKHNATLAAMTSRGALDKDYNFVFTTYSQLQAQGKKETARRDFLRSLAPNSIIVFDESHNAGGGGAVRSGAAMLEEAPNAAEFSREILNQAKGVVYSSATYAKRPEVMSLYSKTDMRHVATDQNTLAEAINAGGVPLQQVVAAMLAESGQYIRRERDFAGIDYDTVPVVVNKAMAESVSDSMLKIKQFDDIKQEALDKIKKDARAEAAAVLGEASTGRVGVESTNFTSIMHNLIDQMLLMLKVDGAIERAEKALARGEKPVITLSNTMGSFIERYASENDLTSGDAIALNFGDMLRRYLERSREVQIGDAWGDKERRRLTDTELGDEGVRAYETALKAIQSQDWSNTPVSPMDYIYQKLGEKGFKVGELSGRIHTIRYNPDGSAVYQVRSAKDIGPAGKTKVKQDFNSGALDVLIIGKVTAGFSVHASEKFTDQKMRRMIVLQPERNIDDHMQKLGRVNRTGQVVKPGYEQLVADIPAEKRPAAVLLKKMASLNANTTASRESAVTAKDVLDFINPYGDEVVATLMEENPDLHKMLGKPLKNVEGGSGLDREDAARKVTGRVPLLPIKGQEEVYGIIEEEYQDYVDRLTALGENKLQAETLDLRAETRYKTEVFKGTGDRPFQRGAYAEEVDVRRLVQPFTSEQVRAAVAQSLKLPADTTAEKLKTEGYKFTVDLLDGIREKTQAYIEKELEGISDLDKRRAQRTKLEGLENRLMSGLRTAHIGAQVKLEGIHGSRYGTVSQIKQKASKNPLALSTYQVNVMMADPSRQMNVPASRLYTEYNKPSVGDSPNVLIVTASETAELPDGSKIPTMEAYDLGAMEKTERRTIITGNLLAGYTEFKKGRIINYTTKDGDFKQGILMPYDFITSKAMAAKDVEFSNAEQIVKFLKSGNRLVRDKDELRVSFAGNRFKFTVPSSKVRGAKYFLNKGILSAADRDFVKVGTSMVLEVKDAEARAVIDELYEQGITLHTDSFKDEARRITSEVLPTATDVKGGDKPSAMPLGGGTGGKPPAKPPTGGGEPPEKLPERSPDPLSPENEDTSLQDDEEYHAAATSGFELKVSDAAEPGFEKAKMSATRVIKAYQAVMDDLGRPTPIRVGKLGVRNAAGVYKHRAEVIRLKTANDITSAGHEIGHALHKVIFGEISARALKNLPLAAQRELMAMGRALYGSRVPTGGYKSEGFAEFTRHWLTEDDAALVAPEMTRYFEGEFFDAHPEAAKSLTKAREMTSEYRAEGAQNRADANKKLPENVMERLNNLMKDVREMAATNWVDENSPMIRVSREIEQILGRELEAGKNPAKVYTAMQGLSNQRVKMMLEEFMMDAAGQRVGPPLKDMLALVRGPKLLPWGASNRESEFWTYMWSRRALERWSKDINPGMSEKDAEFLFQQLDTPLFRQAAQMYYDWNDGLLNYAAQMNPELKPIIDNIKAGSHDYLPLMRVLDDFEKTKLSGKPGAGRGNPLKRQKGSGRAVKDFLPQIIANAEKLVAMSHKRKIVNALVDLHEIEGLGGFIENVPRDQVPQTVSLEMIRKQLEDRGADMSAVDLDDAITFFTPAMFPKGVDPIIPVMRDGVMKWYRIPAPLYDSMEGLDPFRMEGLANLVGASARLFRLGTTGLRPSFGLVTNVLRDFITGSAQSRVKNPARWLGYYFLSMANSIRDLSLGAGDESLQQLAAMIAPISPDAAAVLTKGSKFLESGKSPWSELVKTLGIPMSQPLGADIATSGFFQSPLTKNANRLRRTPIMRVIAQPIDALREVLGTPEMWPRTAEVRSIAHDIGYKIGDPIDQDTYFNFHVRMAEGGKEVTVDFLKGGKKGKKYNQLIPFMNAGIQGTRSFGRTFRRNGILPTFLSGLLRITMITLALWWLNKDKEWYKEMPDREKNAYWNIQIDDDLIVQIPRPQEWGAVFASLPEALANLWHTQDPAGFKDALGFIFDNTVPNFMPVPAKVAKEQLSNRVEFFDRPIVPKSEEDKPPAEQFGPYTSEAAKWIGKNLPNWTVGGVPINSPRRIDAFIREISGGLGSDIAHSNDAKGNRESEAADIPVFGRLFRRGGTEGMSSQSVDKFYDALKKAQERKASSTPESEDEREYRLKLEDARDAMKTLRITAQDANNKSKRAEINAEIRAIARSATAGQSNYNPLPLPDGVESKNDEKQQREDAKRVERLTGRKDLVERPGRDQYLDGMVEEGAGQLTKSRTDFEQFKQKVRKMREAGELTPKEQDYIVDRAEVGPDVYDIRSGSPEAAVNAFERGMKAESDDKRRQGLIDELVGKFERAESEVSKALYKKIAERYKVDLTKK